MKKKILLAAAVATVIAAAGCTPAAANEGADAITLAIIGDWPYNDLLLANSDLLIDSVNADAKVKTVIHVGDIHSGSQPCTSAGILPPIATSNPGWNQQVFQRFQKFNAPMVYTPGDNEWTDCHKTKEKSAGAPMKELAAVRGLFFSRPGITLGVNEMEVASQARAHDPAFPDDAQFVENVMWIDGKVLFVTLNVPGSNNDGLKWAAPFTDEAARLLEVSQRNAANARWLDAAFAAAKARPAKVVVIALQADMFDPAAIVPGGDGLDQYTPLVRQIAARSIEFGGPVLLLNGDSHLYEADHPLADPASSTGVIHGAPPVPNLTRITVQGSTNAPAEWLRLTIDANDQRAPFRFTNVQYCRDPLTSCF